MPNEKDVNTEGVSKLDVMSGSTVSGFITFALLTYSKQLSPESHLLPYLSDQGISFIAAGCTTLLTFLFSLLRLKVNFILHQRNYTNKINYINNLILMCGTPEELEKLNKIKSELLISAAQKTNEF